MQPGEGRHLSEEEQVHVWMLRAFGAGWKSSLHSSQKLIAKFQSGALLTSMIQRNKQYGHGRGVRRGLGLDEIAIIEYHLRDTTNAMQSYFNQCD